MHKFLLSVYSSLGKVFGSRDYRPVEQGFVPWREQAGERNSQTPLRGVKGKEESAQPGKVKGHVEEWATLKRKLRLVAGVQKFLSSISVSCLFHFPTLKIVPRATFKFFLGAYMFIIQENTSLLTIKIKEETKRSFYFLSCILYQSIMASECEEEGRWLEVIFVKGRFQTL